MNHSLCNDAPAAGSSFWSRRLALTTFAAALLAAQPAFAQQAPMYPMDAPPEPDAIPLGTGGVDGQELGESWFRQWGDPMARNISTATLTPFLPDPRIATGAAVIVAPGGGYLWLSMGNEGWEVAEALAARGIAAFVLKYRLRPTPERLEDFEKTMNDLFAGMADDDDSQRRSVAVSFRFRPTRWRTPRRPTP
jgi:acetyl esterase/lipase